MPTLNRRPKLYRLVGFFKHVRRTDFARRDDVLYSPLCLPLGMGILWLTLRQ